MNDFKLLRRPLPFYWSHYGEERNFEGKSMCGVTWMNFLRFCEYRLKQNIKTFVVVIETEDGEEYGLDIFEGEPHKFLDNVGEYDRISVYFV